MWARGQDPQNPTSIKRPRSSGVFFCANLCPARAARHQPMPLVSIRPVQASDIAPITRIYEHAVRHGTASFEIEPPDEADMARRQDALLAAGYPFLVAERAAAEVVGYAYAGPNRARPAY